MQRGRKSHWNADGSIKKNTQHHIPLGKQYCLLRLKTNQIRHLGFIIVENVKTGI